MREQWPQHCGEWIIKSDINDLLLLYLSKLKNVFVQITTCIQPNCKVHSSKLENVFVQITTCIQPNCKVYMSKLQSVYIQIVKCICPKFFSSSEGAQHCSEWIWLSKISTTASCCICPNSYVWLFWWTFHCKVLWHRNEIAITLPHVRALPGQSNITNTTIYQLQMVYYGMEWHQTQTQ